MRNNDVLPPGCSGELHSQDFPPKASGTVGFLMRHPLLKRCPTYREEEWPEGLPPVESFRFPGGTIDC